MESKGVLVEAHVIPIFHSQGHSCNYFEPPNSTNFFRGSCEFLFIQLALSKRTKAESSSEEAGLDQMMFSIWRC